MISLWRFARALAVAGKAADAVRVYSTAEALREEIDAVVSWWIAELNEGTLASVRMQLDEASFAEAWEQGRALTLGEAIALALDSLH